MLCKLHNNNARLRMAITQVLLNRGGPRNHILEQDHIILEQSHWPNPLNTYNIQ